MTGMEASSALATIGLLPTIIGGVAWANEAPGGKLVFGIGTALASPLLCRLLVLAVLS